MANKRTKATEISVTRLQRVVEAFLKIRKGRHLEGWLSPLRKCHKWGDSPTKAVKGISKCHDLFCLVLVAAPNAILPRKNFRMAIKAAHMAEPILMVSRDLDNWAEEMSSMIRCALSKLREIAGDHLKYERALGQAIPP